MNLVRGLAMKLDDLRPHVFVNGILPECPVSVVGVQWYGSEAVELTFKDPTGRVANQLLYRHDEERLEMVERGRPWSFDGDGALFRVVAEAQRIRLDHLFDPLLAVHTSVIDPLPHQITAVYEQLLMRQPLRFLLADDPGAGKTIMAGLLVKELIARSDLQRCLIVCPGSLAEQWQDELWTRFHLPFEILTNDKIEAAHSGNWFFETPLVIARLDKLSRDDGLQQKLKMPDCHWDLVVCDEAHKMSATIFGGDVKFTRRYKLGALLSTLTRHFLLMTATPHNGKEEEFQLFLALLDGDRFEGRFRDGVHPSDVSDLMRRMVKENLLRFDGTPLFPERFAHTVPYRLSPREMDLYKDVTQYVSKEFDRADSLIKNKRAAVGFALTILQRRLASSPEAIYQSIRRRRERLENRLHELEAGRGSGLAGTGVALGASDATRDWDADDWEEMEDAPECEVNCAEQQALDNATAARSMVELKAEIATLRSLESTALEVRNSGTDTKWCELTGVLDKIANHPLADDPSVRTHPTHGDAGIPKIMPGSPQKIIVFSEHRDTLHYLEKRISRFFGRQEAVVVIHGGMGRLERTKAQEAFRFNPDVNVLLATDAAGEGINLQRAHLMVNYDLPWNPNRIEQRFGRIHRIGQTEVCHLWNLVAVETREGEVYQTLLRKIESASSSLKGQVFDVLGKLQFEGKPLRDLLIEAIRYGDQPDVRARLRTTVECALDHNHLRSLLEERALAHETMDARRVYRIREEMERAEARRLQPHYIESFFLEAFSRLGGTVRQRESRRYEVTFVPSVVRNVDRFSRQRALVLSKYERIVFDKSMVAPQGEPLAAFVCPGHPLLDSIVHLTLERNQDILRRGAVLVDEGDASTKPRVLLLLEHSVQDASVNRSGEQRIISKRLLYAEMSHDGVSHHLQYAPYLDYRPLAASEPSVSEIVGREECRWISHELEHRAHAHAVARIVPEHVADVRGRKLDLITKTEAAVKDRLTKEIAYWDQRACQLKDREQAGTPNARLNSSEARKRADQLQSRLERRLAELKRERQISPLPPVVLCGVLVVPKGLLFAMRGDTSAGAETAIETQASAARAREIVMDVERRLGYCPTDREFERLGYDIESQVQMTGKLRFIEVKGRVSRAERINVTRNEILYSLNKPEDYILAIVEFLDDGGHRVHYVRRPFKSEPDFGATDVNYDFAELIARAEVPS